jgi:hypothetical protein
METSSEGLDAFDRRTKQELQCHYIHQEPRQQDDGYGYNLAKSATHGREDPIALLNFLKGHNQFDEQELHAYTVHI